MMVTSTQHHMQGISSHVYVRWRFSNVYHAQQSSPGQGVILPSGWTLTQRECNYYLIYCYNVVYCLSEQLPAVISLL